MLLMYNIVARKALYYSLVLEESCDQPDARATVYTYTRTRICIRTDVLLTNRLDVAKFALTAKALT